MEKKLWSRLRGRRLGDAKFRRQQPIGPYIVDFVCQERRLIVEADGSQHADNDHDRRRDVWLQDKGYRVLRFWNSDIANNFEGVLTAILAALGDGPSPTSTRQSFDKLRTAKSSYPLPQGERRENRT